MLNTADVSSPVKSISVTFVHSMNQYAVCLGLIICPSAILTLLIKVFLESQGTLAFVTSVFSTPTNTSPI